MHVKELDDMLIGDEERIDPLTLVGRTLGSVTGRQLVAASVYDDHSQQYDTPATATTIHEEPYDGGSTFI